MDYKSLQNEKNPKAIFIAEAGINHDGNFETARKMVDAAVDAKADNVKFQTFKAERLVTPNALTSSYIDEGSHKGESFKDLLKRLELNESQHKDLWAYCRSREIKFLSTAFDRDSFDFLLKLGIDVVKVASGDLTNLPLLKHMAQSKLPMIISTGMATLGEIEEAVETVKGQGNSEIILMHCISWYPAEIELTHLRYMETLKNAFGFPVGYSDHTLGITMSVAARALGAVVLEKHFTLDSKQFGPDHAASIEPKEMRILVKCLREVEEGLGSTVRQFGEKEIGQRKVHRRSIVIDKPIKKGEIFTDQNLAVKRPGIGIAPRYWDNILGKKAIRDLSAEQLLIWKDIEI